MTVSAVFVIANEFVIAMFWIERLFFDQTLHDFFNLLFIFATLEHESHVFGELLGVRWLQHGVLNSKFRKKIIGVFRLDKVFSEVGFFKGYFGQLVWDLNMKWQTMFEAHLDVKKIDRL